MQRITLAIFAISIIWAGTAMGVCLKSGAPTDVLKCIEDAMESENSEAYASLLAEDYVAEEYRGKEVVVIADRAETIASMEKFYEVLDVIDVSFSDNPLVTTVETGLWRIETSWSNKVESDDGKHTVISRESSFLVVREVQDPKPHYEIVSWSNVIEQY